MLRIGIECDETHTISGQHACQLLPGAAIATNDHVLLGAHRAHGDLCELERLVHPLAATHPSQQARALADQHWSRQHRQDHGWQRHGKSAVLENARLLGQREQHQRELAGLRQVEPGTRHAEPVGTCCTSGQHGEHRLDEHEQRGEGEDLLPAGKHRQHVEVHADGDKEKP